MPTNLTSGFRKLFDDVLETRNTSKFASYVGAQVGLGRTPTF